MFYIFFFQAHILLQNCQFSIHTMFKFDTSKLPIKQHVDTRLVGIWTLYLWIQYYKLKVKFHYYGHFHYKCINTLPCAFGGGGIKLTWREKGEKEQNVSSSFITSFSIEWLKSINTILIFFWHKSKILVFHFRMVHFSWIKPNLDQFKFWYSKLNLNYNFDIQI